jgi:hypothetical protein
VWHKHQTVLLEQVVHAGGGVSKGAGDAGVSVAYDGVAGKGDISVSNDSCWGGGAVSRSHSRSWQQQQQQPLFPADASSSVPSARVSFATFIALTQVKPPYYQMHFAAVIQPSVIQRRPLIIQHLFIPNSKTIPPQTCCVHSVSIFTSL